MVLEIYRCNWCGERVSLNKSDLIAWICPKCGRIRYISPAIKNIDNNDIITFRIKKDDSNSNVQ
jgi:DNA-directed RNA polymerase subunit RPC12/RpoP